MQKVKSSLLPMQNVFSALLSIIRQNVFLIGKSSFWLIALVDLLLRIFVVQPFGALLAIIVSTIWIIKNIGKIQTFFSKLGRRFATSTNGDEKKSSWLESTGQKEIMELIDWLSSQGITYCNLADEMELPGKSQWLGISQFLNRNGILTQIAGDEFNITWHLPRKN